MRVDKMLLLILKRGKEGTADNFNVFDLIQKEPPYCGISLKRSTYKKDTEALKRFVRHTWPNLWPVKGDKLSNFDRIPFRTELTYTHVNFTTVLLYLKKVSLEKYLR